VHVLLLPLAVVLAVMAAVTFAACSRSAPQEALSASATLAGVTLGITVLVGWTDDSDPPRPGDSQWTAHPASHPWFVLLVGLMLLVLLAKLFTADHRAFAWLAPPAMLLAVPVSFWLFSSLLH
jgi:hypothetical protein